ncbi:TPA: hypothetical protein NKZ51_004001 [Vibrio parahaemolyticus]|nr:hypothetical protein [Vibrio parahaemolyticus]
MSDNVITFIDGFQPLILFLSLLFLLLYYYSELSKSRAIWKPYQANLACTLMSRVFILLSLIAKVVENLAITTEVEQALCNVCTELKDKLVKVHVLQ